MKLLLMFRLLPLCLLGPLCLFAQTLHRQPEIDVQHYEHRISISDDSDTIKGQTYITFDFKQTGVKEIVLDLIGTKSTGKGMRVMGVKFGNQGVNFTHENDELRIKLLKEGQKNVLQGVQVNYEGIPADGLIISTNKFKDRTFFGDNWPNRARNWLPVIDHPADKASCEFIVVAPSHYKVIANGTLIEESNLLNGQHLSHWIERTPIATKVMVMAAARFAVKEYGMVGKIPVSAWCYPQDKNKVFFDYAPAAKILPFFEQKIGPYSYEKLANVQSTTMFGGMENASCIFYAEQITHGKFDLNMEGLLAHEIAHQWFGNSATEKDWKHVWLSESFATYFSALYLENTYGNDTLQAVMGKNRATVFRYSKLNPNGTILLKELPNNLLSILSPLAYEKGACVLHALRYELGDETFWNVMRTYYQRFRNKNAETLDFQQIVNEVSGKNLGWFFTQWLTLPQFPEVEYTWAFDKKSKAIKVLVKQTGQNTYQFPLFIQANDAKGKAVGTLKNLRVSGKEHTFFVPCATKPSTVVLDPEHWILMRAIGK